jgi:flagellar hook-length control protein FliK
VPDDESNAAPTAVAPVVEGPEIAAEVTATSTETTAETVVRPFSSGEETDSNSEAKAGTTPAATSSDEQPIAATTTVAAKPAKPDAAEKSDDEPTDAKDETAEKPVAAGTTPAVETAATAVAQNDPTASRRGDVAKDDTSSDDKPKDVAAKNVDRPTGGAETTRPDVPVRTPAATDPGARTTAAAGGEGTTNLSQVERTRLVQRVAKAVQTAHDRGGELKLRLSPPELGSLKLEVRIHEGVLTARIETETRDAQRVLNENLLVLRERLAEQNIKVERFDVDVFNPGAGGGGNAADLAQQRGDGRGESSERGGSGSREGTPRGEARPADARRAPVATDGRINVVV